jgi:UDP-N-acetylmuramoyl-L-alanyl-D-glutamate--2,6-diaminopimelate ligase
MKKLADILYKAGLTEIVGNTHIAVMGVTADSRKIEPQWCFVALRGSATDGHQYIKQAIDKGATAIICEELPSQQAENVTFVKVQSSAKALGIIAANFYDNPSEKIKLVAVTGTNGKTTVTTLLFNLCRDMGFPCGLISTIDVRINDQVIPATHTTPDSVQLQMHLAKMVEAGVELCFMEASSHGIEQDRLAGTKITGAAFTNLSHDHLDYHKTLANYIRAKKKLFDDLPKDAFALYNADDKNGSVMVQNTKAKTFSYALRTPADYNYKILENDINGLLIKTGDTEFFSTLNGEFNAYNLGVAIAIVDLLGLPKHDTLVHVSKLKPVRGRFEKQTTTTGVNAVIDYAHTPDALNNILESLIEIKTPDQKLIAVVGCGGNRDKEKRPSMGNISAKLADLVIFTSDNPRDEDPQDIINQMENGVEIVHRKKCQSITDRREAIMSALHTAQSGDIVLISGKGHETYQEIKGVKHPFDDREVIESFNKKFQ